MKIENYECGPKTLSRLISHAFCRKFEKKNKKDIPKGDTGRIKCTNCTNNTLSWNKKTATKLKSLTGLFSQKKNPFRRACWELIKKNYPYGFLIKWEAIICSTSIVYYPLAFPTLSNAFCETL